MNLDERFDGLARAAPGDTDSVTWACKRAKLPPDGAVLDAGCGPGPDLAALLAQVPQGRVVAVDRSSRFVARVRGASPQVDAHVADMLQPPGGPFDLIWSGGAVYGPGLTACLDAWRPCLTLRGCLAFTDLVWTTAAPSAKARAFWAADGATMRDADELQQVVTAAGWQVMASCWLPPMAWQDYDLPLPAHLDAAPDPCADEIVALRGEIDLWHAEGQDYGYLLVVARPGPCCLMRPMTGGPGKAQALAKWPRRTKGFPMRRILRLAVLIGGVGLAGCVPLPPEPPRDIAFVEVFSGSGFAGFTRTVVYADDSLLVESAGPGNENPASSRRPGPAGVYDRVAGLVAAEGPGVRARLTSASGEETCYDYGSDTVRAEPAVGGFAMVSASCPEPVVLAFMNRVLGAIPAP